MNWDNLIRRLDQVFDDNFQWAVLFLFILAILVMVEVAWKPFRRFCEWVNEPPACKKCRGTVFRCPFWWKPEMANSLLLCRGVESAYDFPSIPPQECVKCGELR